MHNTVQANATATVNITLNAIDYLDNLLAGRSINLVIRRSVDHPVNVSFPIDSAVQRAQLEVSL